MKVALTTLLALLSQSATTKAADDSAPVFFLIDSNDGECLAGGDFRRCSIHTLFSVSGSSGSYQVHKRPADSSSDNEPEQCLIRTDCSDTPSYPIDVKLGPCTHCGAKAWNILGDASTGFVLSEGAKGEHCLLRTPGTKDATLVLCEDNENKNNTQMTFTPMQLQFASKSDIGVMESTKALLIGAASEGNIAQFEKILKSDDSLTLNAQDWDKLNPLIAAASQGQTEMAKYLIKAGADVQLADKDQVTPLMEAAIQGHLEIVEALVDAGADVDTAAETGVTALFLAAGEGRYKVVEHLLEKGADSTVRRADGGTALLNACTGTGEGQLEVIQVLVNDFKRRGDGDLVNTGDNEGLTPLINLTESKGTLPSIKFLLEEGADVDAESSSGFTPLIIASAHGYEDVVDLYLEKGADIDKMHEEAVTALMYAAASGHTGIVGKLVERGAEIDKKHYNGGTALTEAASGGHVDVVELLISKGADAGVIDNEGISALMAAASDGNLKVCELMLEKNAGNKDYVNLFSESGGSALIYAAGQGHKDIVELLLEKGAKLDAAVEAKAEYLDRLAKMIEEGRDVDPHVDGVTSLHVAASAGHKDVVDLLIETSKKNGIDMVNVLDGEGRSPLVLAVKNNFSKVATTLLEEGADPNVTYSSDGEKDHHLLMDALIVENEDFASLLIEKGADVSYVEEGNISCLLQAAHRGMNSSVQKILEKLGSGSDIINLASDDGVTPIISASSEGATEVVISLLNAGADPSIGDNDGTTPLMAAAARGHLDVIKELLKNKTVDINAQNIDGHTALMFAYNGKNQVETLAERYAQFVSDADDETSAGSEDDKKTGEFITKALKTHKDLIASLVKAGADESIKDKEGHKASDFDYIPDSQLDKDVLEAEKRKTKGSEEL